MGAVRSRHRPDRWFVLRERPRTGIRESKAPEVFAGALGDRHAVPLDEVGKVAGLGRHGAP